MNGSWFDNFGQISFGVTDLDSATRFWQEQMGVGPFSMFYGLTFAAEHEGRKIAFPFNVAIAWHDGRLVELIHVAGDGPSPLHDTLNRPIIGLQRLATLTSDIERDASNAEQRGMERVASGIAAGQRFIYYRSSAAPGLILELLERTSNFDDLCDLLKARAAAFQQSIRPPIVSRSQPPMPSVPATMRAARLHGYGGIDGFSIETVAMPVPGEDQVRLKVAAAAINPMDVKMRRGDLRDWLPLNFPATLGGDVSGVVDAVGSGVRRFAVGDRVAGLVPPNLDGTYAEWVLVPEQTLIHVPAGFDLADAAALPTGAMTGIQLIETGVRPRTGERLLVTGAGGSVGRTAVIAALEAGARVYAGVRASSGTAVADLPVAGVVDLADEDALADAGPFDAIADTVGGTTAERLFTHVRADGIVASVAMPPPVPPAGAPQRFCSLIVSFDGPRLERLMRSLLASGHAMPVAHRLSLAEVARAHALIEAGGVGGKILLQP